MTKAMQFDSYGGIDVLEVRDVPRPVPGAGEVLVEVRAAGINISEAVIRSGALHRLQGGRWSLTFPSGQGSDLAGVVAELGSGVSGFAVGNEVISQIARLEERIAAVHAKLYPKDRLLSIPGIGPVVAGVVRAVVGDLSRFASQASFRAYTGLVPRENSSGEVRQRGRISKAGPSVLRWALYLAGDAARQCDPALADLYRRLMVERGRTHTQAVCAVASHLAGRIYAVARGDRDYVWRDLEGNEITREEARAIAQSLRVDPETRSRLRSRREGGPRTPYARQPMAPQDVTQPSADKLIEAALELAVKA